METRTFPLPILALVSLAAPDAAAAPALTAFEDAVHEALQNFGENLAPPAGTAIEEYSFATPTPLDAGDDAIGGRAGFITELLAWTRIFCDQHGLDYGAVDARAYHEYLRIRQGQPT